MFVIRQEEESNQVFPDTLNQVHRKSTNQYSEPLYVDDDTIYNQAPNKMHRQPQIEVPSIDDVSDAAAGMDVVKQNFINGILESVFETMPIEKTIFIP